MARIRRKVTRTGAKPTRKTKKIILTDEQRAKRREEDTRLAEQLKNVGGAQEDSDCILAPDWQLQFERAALDLLKRL